MEKQTLENELRAYQKLDEETGEVYSTILYSEGFPKEVRANMKVGKFFDNEEDNERAQIKITPIAIRTYTGQMWLTKEDIKKTEEDPYELERSVKNWIEIYFIDSDSLLSVITFKTYGFSEIRNALMRPRPIKTKTGRTKLAKPVFDLELTIGTERQKNDKGDFYSPKLVDIKETPLALRDALEQFTEDHKVYSVAHIQQNMRFMEHFSPLQTPINWYNATNEVKMLQGDGEGQLLEADVTAEEEKEVRNG